jgi:drug/metabolite transporter (DMT)-like permease
MTQPKTWSTSSAHWLMLLSTMLIATSFPVGAAITSELDPAIMMFLRCIVAAAVFAPYVFLKNGLSLPTRSAALRYVALSLPMVVFFWCLFKGLRSTSALNSSAIFTFFPVFTALFALLINREKISRNRSLAIGLGSIGALWIIFRGDLNALLSLGLNQGDLIVFAGVVVLGIYGPLVKLLYRGEPQEIMTFWTLVAGSIWLMLLSGTDLLSIQWGEVEPKVYFGILYLAVATTLITFFIGQIGAIRLSPTKASAYSFLTPAIVIGLNLLAFATAVEWQALPGILLVSAAVIVIQRETIPQSTAISSTEKRTKKKHSEMILIQTGASK